MATTQESLRLSVFGAAPDTWNLGVSALLTSVVGVAPKAKFTVFDNMFGVRRGHLQVGGDSIEVELIGARHSRRLHRTDTLARIAVAGVSARSSNPALVAARASDVILDLSGGDSFSDIYGWGRYSQVLLHKRIARSSGRPVVLLPQTYGPFRTTLARRLAVNALRQVDVAFARDPWSYDQLHQLVGDDFDPRRHRSGVDMAFALPSCVWQPEPSLDRWLARERPIVGLNISGMLYLDRASSHAFGLAGDYRSLVHRLVREFLDRTEADVFLVPHVVAPPGHPQSDAEAAQHLAAHVDAGDRVRVAPLPRSASEAKAMIARTDWFAGSRMHATIAALSSGVPAAALAYSVKAAGVFETAGVRDHVVELANESDSDALDRLLWSFEERVRVRPQLIERAVRLREQASEQLLTVLEAVGTDDRSVEL